MKTRMVLVLLVLGGVALCGCGSVYTNIEKTGDNAYLVTRVKQGFFSVYGDLYSCRAESETRMTCTHVGEP